MSKHLLDLGVKPNNPFEFVASRAVPDRVAVVHHVDQILYVGPLKDLPAGDIPMGSHVHISYRDYEAIERKTRNFKQIEGTAS